MFTAAEVATFAGRAEDEAVAFKGALEMASGKALPIISAISVASRLKSLVGAPVALDDATVALRYKPHHQGGSFFVARIAVGMSRTLRAGNLGRNGSLFGRPEAPNFIKKPDPSIDSTRSLIALKFPISPEVPTRSSEFNHLSGRGFFAVSGGFRPRVAPMTAAVLGAPKTRKRSENLATMGEPMSREPPFRQEQVRIHMAEVRQLGAASPMSPAGY